QDEGPLLGRLRLIHRHEDGAEPVGGEGRRRPLDAVVGYDPDAIPPPDTERGEPAPQLLHLLQELGVGDPVPAAPLQLGAQRVGAAVFRDGALQKLYEGLEGVGHAIVVSQRIRTLPRARRLLPTRRQGRAPTGSGRRYEQLRRGSTPPREVRALW